MRLWAERCYPAVFGLAAGVAWLRLDGAVTESPRDLLATLVSLASIVVGFLATAISIVVSAPPTSLIRELRDSGYSHDLVRYLKEPFVVGLALLALAVAGYFLKPEHLKHSYCVAALITLTAWLVAALARIGFVFLGFLKASAFRAAAAGNAQDSKSQRPPAR